MNPEYGSLLESNSQFNAVRDLRDLIVLIRSSWFHKNTRIVQSQISFASGVLFNGDCILTAAHNIYEQRTQLYCDEVEIIFNFNAGGKILSNNPRIHIALAASNFRCSLVRKNKGQAATFEHDIVLIKLPHNFPWRDKIADLSSKVQLLENYQLQNEKGKGFIAGFPDLSLSEVEQFKAKRQRENGGRPVEAYLREDVVSIKRVEEGSMFYHCSTLSGQSGSPILVPIVKNGEVKYFIVGVHNSFSKSKSMGKGVFINGKMADLLKLWYNQMSDRYLFIQNYQFLRCFPDQVSSDYSNLPELSSQPSQMKSEEEQELKNFMELEFKGLLTEIHSYYKVNQQKYRFSDFLDQLRTTFKELKAKVIEEFYRKLKQELAIIEQIEDNFSYVKRDLPKPSHHLESKEYINHKTPFPDQQQEQKYELFQPNKLFEIPDKFRQINESFLPLEQLISQQISPLKLKIKPPKQYAKIQLPIFQQLQQKKQAKEQKLVKCCECLQEVQVWWLCLDSACIQQRAELCQNCVSCHNRHKCVKADAGALTQFYQQVSNRIFHNDQQVKEIEGCVTVLTNLINMNLLKKMFEGLPPKIIKTLRFLSSLLSNNEEAIQDNVREIINNHNKEEMYKLHLNYQLANSVTSSQLISMLETEVSYMQHTVVSLYQSIRDRLEQYKLKIPEFNHFQFDEYESKIAKQYESVINIKNKQQFIVSPLNIYDVKEHYYPYIKEIVLNKDAEEYKEYSQIMQKRKRRAQFWLLMYKLKEKIKRKIIKNPQFLQGLSKMNNEQLKRWTQVIDGGESSENEESPYSDSTEIEKKINLFLYNRFYKFRDEEQFAWESSPLEVIGILLHPKMTSLVKLQLRYESVRCCEFNCRYKLDAVTLFLIIHRNPNLRKVVLEGIRVYHFGRFIHNLWRLRCKGSIETCSFQQEQDQQKKKEEKQLIEKLNPSNLLVLDLRILLKIKNKDVIYSVDYFMRMFPTVCNLKVQLNYGDSIQTFKDDPQLLPLLFQNLQKIRKLKVWILGQYLSSNLKLLECLQGLTNIDALYVSDFEEPIEDNSKGLTFQQMPPVANSIGYTFGKHFAEIINNNEIQKLSIKRCSMMNLFFQVSAAKEIIVVVKNSFVVDQKYLTNPSIVELIYLQNVQFNEEKLLPFIRQLRNYLLHHLVHSNITGAHLKAIPILALNRLRILNISECGRVGDDFADEVFAQLQVLVILDISKTSISPTAVLKIPSIDLLKLEMSGLAGVNDDLLRLVDAKWPMLLFLNIYDCRSLITRRSINQTTFRSLNSLQISRGILDEKTMSRLLVRGVEILPFH